MNNTLAIAEYSHAKKTFTQHLQRTSTMNRFVAVPPFAYPVDVRKASQYQGRRHGKCAAEGTKCYNRPTNDVIRGEVVKSLYCEYHHCRMVEQGRLCRIAKPPRNERYCNSRECDGSKVMKRLFPGDLNCHQRTRRFITNLIVLRRSTMCCC